MNTRDTVTKLIPAVMGATALAVAGQAQAQEEEDEEEFDEARLYFELNHTDGDLGIHGFLDGDAWKSVDITGPEPLERPLLNIWVRSKLRKQGLTELFFESDEPDFDELSPAQFFNRFPEGTYEITGKTLGGGEIESEVELSHTLAGPPGNVMVNGEPAAENCDAEDLPSISPGDSITISWDAVTMSHPELGNTGLPVTVDLYQVVGEFEFEEDDREFVMQADILPDSHAMFSFTFPTDFSNQAEEEFKFEIIMRLDNGNQTAVESCVEIEEED